MPTKKSSTLAKQQQQHFKWYYAIILVALIAIAGIIILRFSQAGTGAIYSAANGQLNPIAHTPAVKTFDSSVSDYVWLSNIAGNQSAFYEYTSIVPYQPGSKVQSCVYYSVNYVPEKDRVATTISVNPNTIMVSDSSGGTQYTNGPNGYRIACSNFLADHMKTAGAFPANAAKGVGYNVKFQVGAGFNSTAANIPLKIWKADRVLILPAK